MTSSRAPRTMRTDDEITTLLALVNEKKLSDLLDSKRQKNKDIIMDLERCLKEQGLTWTWELIRTCWKNLKKRFTAERLLLCKSGGEPSKWKWFDKMGLLLGDHPMVQERDYGVDTAAEDEGIVLLCDGSEEEGDASDDLDNCVNNRSPQRRERRLGGAETAHSGESAGLEERKPVPEDGLSARLDAKHRCDHRSPQLVLASSYKLGRVEPVERQPGRLMGAEIERHVLNDDVQNSKSASQENYASDVMAASVVSTETLTWPEKGPA
ncbi:hypothetical protein HPB51_011330 [Rhipicephalus microplus]|uniref:Myb/SANT-like DNA-binding domain-containing protein n=1 Tax=Rhipicephalus microplus TaxID=6941 RepID=A0A9J6DMS7_RHIMP|nr:hypothetical protein HPB51_011330 [Rhipicephalus microplus]